MLIFIGNIPSVEYCDQNDQMDKTQHNPLQCHMDQTSRHRSNGSRSLPPEGKVDHPGNWEMCLNLHLSNGQTHKVIECFADVCAMIETDPLPDEITGSCIVEKASGTREFMFKTAYKGTAI